MTTAGPATLTVTPVAGALGAAVTGIDLAQVSEAAQLDQLRRALADHLVVFLPEQDLSLDDLERVTELLGGRDVTPFVDPLEERPYVIRVIKEPTDVLNFANAWHSDLSYLPAPPAYTLLHAWDVPDHGGDTVWSNQYLAYDSLSHGLRATLDGLSAVHSAGLAYGTGGLLDQVKDLTSMAIAPSADAYAEHVHPAVTVHPVTASGRCTSIRSTRRASRGGRRRSPGRCWRTCTATASTRTSPAACAGPSTRSPSGTTGARCTTRSTTTAACAARCTARASRVPHPWECAESRCRGCVRAPGGARTQAVRRSGAGAADDGLVEVERAGRALEERTRAVVEDPAIGGEGQVAPHVGSGGDAHHRGVQVQAAGRPEEVGLVGGVIRRTRRRSASVAWPQ